MTRSDFCNNCEVNMKRSDICAIEDSLFAGFDSIYKELIFMYSELCDVSCLDEELDKRDNLASILSSLFDITCSLITLNDELSDRSKNIVLGFFADMTPESEVDDG